MALFPGVLTALYQKLKIQKEMVHFILIRLRFWFIHADTSRPPREGEEDGKGYHFTSREEMEVDIKAGQYLENGDFEGNLYGTKVDSIRDIMRSGKMCILDVNATVSDFLVV